MYRQKKGFSLIEVAAIMTLAGLVLSATLQYSLAQREKARYELTHKRLAEIRTALIVFAADRQRLPCPQSPLKAEAPRRHGNRFSTEEDRQYQESCGPDASPSEGITVSSAEVRQAGRSPEVWTGAVPARELRLNDEQAYDGWGRLFTFSVSRALTLPKGLKGGVIPSGVISVVNETGQNVLDAPGSARYVLVSHGPTGLGGWTADGGQNPCEKKTLDGGNCDGDSIFVSAPFSLKKGKPFFDDFILHDDLDVGGTLVDKLMRCNTKKKFYTPGNERADPDGCTGPTNVLEGACLLSVTLDEADKPHRSPPVAILAPAIAKAEACGCKEGYAAVEVGTWDDMSRTGVNMAWTTEKEGTSSPDGQVHQTPELSEHGLENQQDQEKYRTRTSLYTCVQ